MRNCYKNWRRRMPNPENQNKSESPIVPPFKQKTLQGLTYRVNWAFRWCHLESNQGHMDFQSIALPTELWHRWRAFRDVCVSQLRWQI